MKLLVSGFGFPWKGNSFKGGGYYGIFTSQSIRGGGKYGQFLSQSIQGGGSVSGVPFAQSSIDGHYNNVFGLFFKVAALPSSDMMLIDYNASVTGYFRCKLTSAGKVVLESGWSGHVRSVDITGSTTVSPGSWYYVTGQGRDSQGNWQIQGQVTGPGGVTAGFIGSGFQSDSNFNDYTTGTAALGVGVALSTSYLNFPNTAGNELSKIAGYRGLGNVSLIFGVPSSDQSPSGLDFLYLCRDTVGSSTCTDSTSNAYNLTPGANGLTVVTDGPYP